MTTAAPALIAMALLAAAVVPGGRPFAVAVLVVAAVAIVQYTTALDATGPRPVVAAVAIAGLGVPLVLMVTPQPRLDAVPPLITAMVLVAFLLSIVAGRRADIVQALSVTFACGLLVGLGAGGLIVVRESRAGLRWSVALLLLILVPEAVSLLAGRVGDLSRSTREAVRFATAALIGIAVLALSGRPVTPGVALGLVAVCLAAMYAAALLERVVSDESLRAPAVSGAALRPITALLVAAPVVSLLVAAVQT